MTTTDGWIEIVGWDRFQHYADRRPTWIKLYPRLLDDDAFVGLSWRDRYVLIGLWMMYASSDARLRLDVRSISRRLDVRVTSGTIERLTEAGFIRITASPTLADRYPRDRDRVIKNLDSPDELGKTDPLLASMSISNEVGTGLAATRLLDDIRDADRRTQMALRLFERRLPEAAFAQALEALRARRAKAGKPLASEARYVVATLTTIEQERTTA